MRGRAKGWLVFSTRPSPQGGCGAAGSSSPDHEPRARRPAPGLGAERRTSRRPGRAAPAGPSPTPGSAILASGGRTEAARQPEVAWPRRTTGAEGRPAAGQSGDRPAAPSPGAASGGSPGGAEAPAAAAPLYAHRHPAPSPGRGPPLASLPGPCRGSGAGEFRRAASAAERSTGRAPFAELRRWAGPGRAPGALATPTPSGAPGALTLLNFGGGRGPAAPLSPGHAHPWRRGSGSARGPQVPSHLG